MKKKLIFVFATVCLLCFGFYVAISNTLYYAKINEVLEYEYDFTSDRTLYDQFENLGFKPTGTQDDASDIDFGFARLSIFGSEKLTETRDGRHSDKGVIMVNFMERPFSENDKKNIRNFLLRQYGEPETILMSGEELLLWNSPVLRPHLPIMRWESDDRYLYLNDYPDIDVFQIRTTMK